MSCNVITGKYELVSSENFDEYMKAVGVGFITRKAAANLKPVQEITVDGDTYTIKTITTLKTSELKFQLGKEFDEETLDGRKCKSTITLENGNKLVHSQNVGGKTLVMTREFMDNELQMILTADKVVSKRVYKRMG